MKLHCPHCGVKGSAEDSYSGRTVKCPKCRNVFEVMPDMAIEQPEDADLFSATSSATIESPAPQDLDEDAVKIAEDEDLWGTGADEELSADEAKEDPREVDETPAESEREPVPAALQEETLDWEDIASENELQSAEGEIEEEYQELPEENPADLNSLHDEFEFPAGDIDLAVAEDSDAEDESGEDLWAVVEPDPEEESSIPEPADSEGIDNVLEDELEDAAELDESFEEGSSGDEDPLVQEAGEIELQPYGIDEEECWQCGKKDSSGEPFTAKDGRLYCNDCAPIADPDKVAEADPDQNADDTISGQTLNNNDADLKAAATAVPVNEFSIRDAIRKAWAKTKGAKGAIWAGSAIMYLVILIIVAGGAFLLPSTSDSTGVTGWVSNILFQSVANLISVLFTAGLLLMGINKVAGDTISWRMIFKGFSCAGRIIVATILQSVLVAIGFLLLVLPGIYLSVGYAMTLPLIVDKGLSPWQAMEMSRKAIHKIWWKVAGLFLVMAAIFVVSFIPMGIGLIWTWPMFIIVAGVLYQHLFLDEGRLKVTSK